MKTEIAQQISDELTEVMKRLDQSIRFVMENCSPEEFSGYRAAVGRVMGALVLDVINPLYSMNPDVIKPEGYHDE